MRSCGHVGIGFVCLFLLGCMVDATAAAEPWQALKGKHFVVRHRGEADTAREVLQRAEVEYDRLARLLGFTRRGDFWLWDNRVGIRLYASRKAYVQATGAPWWSAGRANYRARTIDTFVGSKTFLDAVLPHEMTHLVFREFVGFDADVPLWLDEGVAQWATSSANRRFTDIAVALHAKGELWPLARIMRHSHARPGRGGEAVRFYAQSASLVAFMIETYGAQRFRRFCGQLRDGKDLDAALRFTYASTIRNLEELERSWHRYLEEKHHD